MYTTNDIFNLALSAFSGVSASSFSGKNNLIADAMREVKSNVDIPESRRVLPLYPIIINGDQCVALPEDIDAIISVGPIQPKSIGNSRNTHTRVSTQVADEGYLSGYTAPQYAVEYFMGIPYIRLQGQNTNADGSTVVQTFISDVGIVAAGDASGLSITDVWYLTDGGALDFSITQNTGISSITDTLSDVVEIGDVTDKIFTTSIFVPAALVGKLTSIKMRVGSSPTDFYEMTATKNNIGNSFTEGYNTIVFTNKTTTGVPNNSLINYIYLELATTLTAGTTVNNVRIDNVSVYAGVAMQVEYYSESMFIDATSGQYIRTPTSAGLSDKVYVGRDVINLLVHELRKIMDSNRSGNTNGGIWQKAQIALFGGGNSAGAYATFRLKNPSSKQVQITQYATR